MRELTVFKKDINLKEWSKRGARENDYSKLITEPVIIKNNEGKILCIYAKLESDPSLITKVFQSTEYATSMRTRGLKTTSRVFGFLPRETIRKDFCSATSMAKIQPKHHAVVCEYGKNLAKVYKYLDPEMYEKHIKQTEDEIQDGWVLEKTPFTSGIINKNNPLNYHFDRGNFRDVYSAMLTIKKDIQGGNLVLPEYDVAFQLDNNSVFLFDGQGILHGVTPIKKTSTRAYRFTAVYYTMKQMWQCDDTTVELERVRRLKTEKEDRRNRYLKGELTEEELMNYRRSGFSTKQHGKK